MSERNYVANARGHQWRLDERGDVDDFGLDVDYHNGPVCVSCGYSFCQHCQEGPDDDCPGPPTLADRLAEAIRNARLMADARDRWLADAERIKGEMG
jgi:hypothetical protein